MKCVLLLIFLLSLCTGNFCQGTAGSIDSLKEIIKHHPGESTTRIQALYNLSYAVKDKDPKEAMKYAAEGLEAALKMKWDSGIALGYRQKAIVHYSGSENAQSLEYCLKALKAGELLNNKLFEATVYNNMANIYADFGQFEKALDHYQKLLVAAEKGKSSRYILIAVFNIGTIYIETGKLNMAEKYFDRSLTMAKEAKNTSVVVSVLNNLGKIYEYKGDDSNALDYYKQAIALSDSIGNLHMKAAALNNAGKIFYRTGNYTEATKFSMNSLSLAEEIGDVSWQANAWKTLSDIYERQNQFEKALHAFKKNTVLEDSMVGIEKREELVAKEMQFEFEKKEAVLRATHQLEVKQQQTKRKGIVLGSGVLVAGGLFSFFLYKRKRDAVQQQKEASFKAEVTDTEMKALRAQMNPHFIFNSLNSISDYIAKNDIRSADRYLSKFARLMRLILENSEEKEVPLARDLKALELYMQLEALRMNHKFSYEIKVAEGLDQETTMVPPLILQPFVENSIWHGIAKKEGQGKILIHIKREGAAMINCIVEDDGVGRQQTGYNIMPNQQQEKTSLGMKITQMRIDILNKLKNTTAAVELSDLAQGLRVEVKLPLATNF